MSFTGLFLIAFLGGGLFVGAWWFFSRDSNEKKDE